MLVPMLSAVTNCASGKVERIAYRGWQNCYRLSNGTADVIVVAESGGRVMDYSLKGKNIIYVDRRLDGKTLKDYQTKWFDPDGGRFDYGPEPVTRKIHDVTWMGPYEARMTGEYSLRIVSQPDKSLGLQTIREFSLDENSSRLIVRQTMRNLSDRETKWWFWDRTLAKAGGTMLVPLNPKSKLPKEWGKYVWGKNSVEIDDPQDDRIRISNGILTMDATGRGAVFGTDATAGWMAYATDGLLFVKRFPYFPSGEYREHAGFTVRLYTDNAKCELEPVSPQAVLKPDESYSFTEYWWLLEYPPAKESAFDLNAAVQFILANTSPPPTPAR